MCNGDLSCNIVFYFLFRVIFWSFYWFELLFSAQLHNLAGVHGTFDLSGLVMLASVGIDALYAVCKLNYA